MQLGALAPFTDFGGDPQSVRDYAQGIETIGLDFMETADHVIGANVASRPDWGADRNTSADFFHDPFVLLSYVAGVAPKLSFSTGVLIVSQRQTALVAKQAACLDVLCEGRFRLGIGVGWNDVEYVALNENFKNRGRRSEEQVQVMQALWKQDHVTFAGKYHTIEDAGINPRPTSGRVPIWYGGHHENTLSRIAKWGDGWMPNRYLPDQSAIDVFAKLRAMVEAQGRDPAELGIEVWTSCGEGSEADWRKEALFWKELGVSHICLTTNFDRRNHNRIAGTSLSDHLAAIQRYYDALADIL